ncbi:MAG: hypothetical protein H0W24_09010 [Lysobacter sp.]|nr:hypothetical protein [Lysobacter sp.]
MVIDAEGRRVALLARPGLARERLSEVLQEAGANCVISADPTQLKPEELRDMRPEIVVVALDPLTEEALEQFDEVLGDKAVEVIYEEAEHAASREGWDAARWQRHLVAKLQGHANVLPPSREPVVADAAASAPADDAGPAPAEAAAAIAETAVEAPGLPDADAAEMESVSTSSPANAFDPVNAEFDGFDLDSGFAPYDPSLSGLSLPDDDAPAAGHSADPADLEMPSWDEVAPGPAAPDDAFAGFDFTLDTAPQNVTEAVAADAAGAGGFDDFDAVAALNPRRAQLDEPDAAAAEDGQGTADSASFGELSLQDDEHEAGAKDTPSTRDSFRHDLIDLEQRISSLSLVDDTPRRGPEATGAVLILSGVGGPDAVRQLLGALPTGFARPVLVQQRLEGGRYDRLVTQLQRATRLTVVLAEPAQTAEAGTVYILSDSIGATADEGGIRFSEDASHAVIAALPSSDSAVLLLSGSDPAHVEAAMAHSRAGALVAGQAAEGCYDAAAPDALAAHGGEVAAPAALALRLSARWSTRGVLDVQA